MKTIFMVLLLSIFIAGGCVFRSSTNAGGMTAYDGVSDGHKGDAQALAEKTAQALSLKYPPGHTSISLVASPGVFGQSLENALRQKGFIVVPGEQSAAVRVAYTLDGIQGEDRCYLQVKTSDGGNFGFVRELTNDPGVPITEPPLPSRYGYASNEAALPEKNLPASMPMSPAVASANTGNSGSIPIRSAGKAEQIAKRNKVSVADFCRWNKVSPQETLPSGKRVFLQEPPTATAAASTSIAEQPLPISAGPVAAPPASPVAPVPAVSPISPVASPVASAKEPVLVASASTTMRDASTIRPIPVVVADEPAPLPAAATTPSPATAQKPVEAVKLPPAAEPIVVAPVSAQTPPVAALPSTSKEPQHSPFTPIAVPTADTPATPETWNITPGTLRAQVVAWAARAGYQIVWKAEHDFDIEAHANFRGDFLGAMEQLFSGLQRVGTPLRVTVYKSNNVLEVQEN